MVLVISTSCGTTRSPSSTVPRTSLAFAGPSGTPLTFARYSRSTPYRGCATRIANSPSLVRITSPSEWKSRRPTGYTRSPNLAPRTSSTVVRPCGSSVVVITPSGL